MIPFLIGLLVFAATGFGLTYWLRAKSAAQPLSDTPRRGAEQLSQLRWRDFVRLVLQAMHGRGYRPISEPGGPADGIPTDGSDILLERANERALLSCQYGSGATVGAQIVHAAATAASLRGVDHVIIVTPGRFESGATQAAVQNKFELIDGEALWPEVRPYVAHPDGVAPVATPPANSRAQLMSWGGAALAGVIVWALAGALLPNHAQTEAAAAQEQQDPVVAMRTARVIGATLILRLRRVLADPPECFMPLI